MSQILVLGLMLVVFALFAGKEALEIFRWRPEVKRNPRRQKFPRLRNASIRALFRNRAVTLLSGIVVAVLIAWVLLPERSPSGKIDSVREGELTMIGTWTWGGYDKYETNYQLSVGEDGSSTLLRNYAGFGFEHYGEGSWYVASKRYVDTHEEYFACVFLGFSVDIAVEILSASRARVTLWNGGHSLDQRVAWMAYKKTY